MKGAKLGGDVRPGSGASNWSRPDWESPLVVSEATASGWNREEGPAQYSQEPTTGGKELPVRSTPTWATGALPGGAAWIVNRCRPLGKGRSKPRYRAAPACGWLLSGAKDLPGAGGLR